MLIVVELLISLKDIYVKTYQKYSANMVLIVQELYYDPTVNPHKNNDAQMLGIDRCRIDLNEICEDWPYTI